jgi:hypothetical protein
MSKDDAGMAFDFCMYRGFGRALSICNDTSNPMATVAETFYRLIRDGDLGRRRALEFAKHIQESHGTNSTDE